MSTTAIVTLREAKEIVVEAHLEETAQSLSLKYALYTAEERREIFQTQGDSLDARICAAIEIQKTFRGYGTRARLQALLGKEAPVDNAPPPTRESEYEKQMKKHYNGYRKEVNRRKKDAVNYDDFCANYGTEWRQKLQEEYRAERKPMTDEEFAPLAESAAVKIQRSWRRHIDVQVFRYYKDLINFKARGDPAAMLRCINPNEAKLLDAAAGIHLKFRLAGDRFPPNIYYKIFTHRPIQDLCANSPKDYTHPAAKQPMMKHVHNRGVSPFISEAQWYRRWENNGWRLVSDRLIQMSAMDPISWETSRKTVDFDHSKLHRRQDVERRKKEKKIEWMKKMYRDGMLQAKSNEPDTVALIDGATKGMVATAEMHGPNAIEEWEVMTSSAAVFEADWQVDELLRWTTSLNYDEYWSSWKVQATSAVSEDLVGQVIEKRKEKPLELVSSINSGYKHASSTRPSHNTPVSNESFNT